MSAIYSAPIWLLFIALALPLLVVSAGGGMPRHTVTAFNDNGQVFFKAHSGSRVEVGFGAIAIAANARSWAAAAVMTGLLLTSIGLAGLFHFPSPAPFVDPELSTSRTKDLENVQPEH